MHAKLWILVLIGVAIPPLLQLLAILHFGINFPVWDDWALSYGNDLFFKAGARDWHYIMAREGVHFVPLLKLFYSLLGEYFHWNFRVGMFFGYFVTILFFGCLCYVIKDTVPKQPVRWVLYPLASFFFFSLNAWILYTSCWGWCWLLNPTLFLVGLILLRPPYTLLQLSTLVISLSILGSCSQSSGYDLWIVIPEYLWLRGDITKWISFKEIIGLGFIWLLALTFPTLNILVNYGQINTYDQIANYMAPEGTQQISPISACFQRPVYAFFYLVAFLGTTTIDGLSLLNHYFWSLTFQIGLDLTFGLFALSLFSFCFIWYLLNRKAHPDLSRKLSPWLAFSFLGIGMATLCMVGRIGGYGMGRALDSHYAFIGICFQFSTYLGAYLIWEHIRDHPQDSFRFSIPPRIFTPLLFAGILTTSLLFLCAQPVHFFELASSAQTEKFEKEATWLYPLVKDSPLPYPLAATGPARLEFFFQNQILHHASAAKLQQMIQETEATAPSSEARFQLTGQGASFYDRSKASPLLGETALIEVCSAAGSPRFYALPALLLEPRSYLSRLAPRRKPYKFYLALTQVAPLLQAPGTFISAVYILRDLDTLVKIYAGDR